jgi:hypothetical protein
VATAASGHLRRASPALHASIVVAGYKTAPPPQPQTPLPVALVRHPGVRFWPADFALPFAKAPVELFIHMSDCTLRYGSRQGEVVVVVGGGRMIRARSHAAPPTCVHPLGAGLGNMNPGKVQRGGT